MSTADPFAAVCSFLQTTVGELLAQTGVGGTPAIFRPSLPEDQDQNMPQACIVVRPAGGYKMFGLGRIPVADPVMDIICYGTTDLQAQTVASAAVQQLRQLTQSRWNDTLLYWARIAAGPVPLPDTQTLWPSVWFSIQVMHAEIAFAGDGED